MRSLIPNRLNMILDCALENSLSLKKSSNAISLQDHEGHFKEERSKMKVFLRVSLSFAKIVLKGKKWFSLIDVATVRIALESDSRKTFFFFLTH